MDVTEFFLKLLLILVSAKVMAELFSYAGLPSVIGEVVAGILIGPSLLNLVAPEPTFLLLAQMGVILLLFQVGMETDVAQVVAVGGQSVLVAFTGVLLPFAFGYAASRHVFGQPGVEAVFIGGTLVATSIGITLRVLKDLGGRRTHVANVVLGSAVLDDVIGVVLLAVLLEYTLEGSLPIGSSLRVLGFVALFLVAAPVLSRLFLSFMAKMDRISKTTGILPTILIAFILALSAMAHGFGAPEIVGAFAAGLAITRKSVFEAGRHQQVVRDDMVTKGEESIRPVSELFVPVFFVMVGVSMNLQAVDFGSTWFWLYGGTLTALAFVSKALSGVWVKGSFYRKAAVGVAMIPRGEVGLIFAQTGLKNGIFDDATYTSMVLVVAVTTLFAPILLKAVMRAGKDGM
jgi:Kef-type K+ transport system membrane component KefB